MFTFKELYYAYLRCRKGKRNTINALEFEQNLCENIYDLETLLNTRAYTPKKSICFLVRSPKLREVFAADFRDRVVHHLITPVLEQIYEPGFIYDSYSCRAGKGIHNAQKRALKFSRGAKYYLQLDIKNFFYEIDKKVLFSMLNKEIVKNYHKTTSTDIALNEMLWLIYTIIFHNVCENVSIKGDKEGFKYIPAHKTLFKVPKHKGLPIGNLTSQFFANVYMNGFDNYCKRELKCKRYLRYVDDFVVFDDSKDRLYRIKDKIESYLKERLGLKLKDEVILKETKEGLNFLGYVIRPHYVLARKRVVNNYKKKKALFLEAYIRQKGKMDLGEIKQFLSVQASFAGHIKHANGFNLYKKVGVVDEIDPFSFDKR